MESNDRRYNNMDMSGDKGFKNYNNINGNYYYNKSLSVNQLIIFLCFYSCTTEN